MYSIMPISNTNPGLHSGLNPRLDSLLKTPCLWRGSQYQLTHGAAQSGELSGLHTGYPALDACLPWQGWPAHALVEIITPQWGAGELQLVLPLLRRLSAEGKWILWVSPPCLPYAPGLRLAGVDTGQIVVVKAGSTHIRTLWSIEKALQNRACALVLAWPGHLTGRHIRRLQLAASTGQTLGVLFHQRNIRHSASVLRMRVESSEDALQVAILKARGSYRRDTVTLARGLP